MAVTRKDLTRCLATGLPRSTMTLGVWMLMTVAAFASDNYPRYRGSDDYSSNAARLLRSWDQGNSYSRDDDRDRSPMDDIGYRGSYSTGNPRRYDDRSMSLGSYDLPRSRRGFDDFDRDDSRLQLRDPLGSSRTNRYERPLRTDDSGSDRYSSDRYGSDRLNVRYDRSRDLQYRDDIRLDDRRYDDRSRNNPSRDGYEYDAAPRREERYRPSYDRIPSQDRGLDLDRLREYDRGPSLDNRYDPRNVPPSQRPTEENDAQTRQRKITARYGNPVIQRFVQNVSPQQGIRLYQEAMQLVDTRHLQPTSYEVRVRQAMGNLVDAANDRGFQQANGVSLGGQQVAALESSLMQLMSSRPVRSSTDAVNMLQWAMDAAGRQAGIRPGAVTLEFLYGATDSLDKYSSFMPEDNPSQPSAAILDDHVVGIGVEIKPDDRGAVVKKVLPGGPAAQAGLQSGDVLVSVNGQQLAGQTLDYAVDLITGRAGTPVQVGVLRGDRQGNFTLVRRQVAVASVSDVQMLDQQNGIGYLRLDKFAQNSEQEVDKALWTLHQQGMQTLIFDVRGNPGGLLTTAITLADKFLPSGTIVSTRGRTQADNSSEQAHRGQTWKTPIVVMIDEESASASEIFAAAIQDNQRGLVVGRHSYGKGTVQTHFPLQTVSGYLKLTTAKFYSPSGREMAGQGVEPDVYVSGKRNDEATLQNDSDVAAAVRVAGSSQVKELVNATGRR